jgi:hypothetical protein
MFDAGQADDKILAVLDGDAAYGAFGDLGDCPPALVERSRAAGARDASDAAELHEARQHPVRVKVLAREGPRRLGVARIVALH